MSTSEDAHTQAAKRPHDWKSQQDVDGNTYRYCVRIGCGVIWSRAYEPQKPEPKGCKGQDAQ